MMKDEKDLNHFTEPFTKTLNHASALSAADVVMSRGSFACRERRAAGDLGPAHSIFVTSEFQAPDDEHWSRFSSSPVDTTLRNML